MLSIEEVSLGTVAKTAIAEDKTIGERVESVELLVRITGLN